MDTTNNQMTNTQLSILKWLQEIPIVVEIVPAASELAKIDTSDEDSLSDPSMSDKESSSEGMADKEEESNDNSIKLELKLTKMDYPEIINLENLYNVIILKEEEPIIDQVILRKEKVLTKQSEVEEQEVKVKRSQKKNKSKKKDGDRVDGKKIKILSSETTQDDKTVVMRSIGEVEVQYSRCTIKLSFTMGTSVYELCVNKLKLFFQ